MKKFSRTFKILKKSFSDHQKNSPIIFLDLGHLRNSSLFFFKMSGLKRIVDTISSLVENDIPTAVWEQVFLDVLNSVWLTDCQSLPQNKDVLGHLKQCQHTAHAKQNVEHALQLHQLQVRFTKFLNFKYQQKSRAKRAQQSNQVILEHNASTGSNIRPFAEVSLTKIYKSSTRLKNGAYVNKDQAKRNERELISSKKLREVRNPLIGVKSRPSSHLSRVHCDKCNKTFQGKTAFKNHEYACFILEATVAAQSIPPPLIFLEE